MRFPALAAAAVCIVVAAQAAPSAQAQTQAPAAQSVPAPLFASAPITPGWTFTVAPYVWLASVNAKIDTPVLGGGVATTDVSVPFSDILHDLRFGVLLAGEARYDQFSILTDIMYLNLGLSASAARLTSINPGSGRIDIPALLGASASTGLGTTIWTTAGGYTLAAGAWGNIDAIVGARLLAIDLTSNYNLTAAIMGPGGGIALARSGHLSANIDDWEGVVGGRGRFNIPNSSFFVPFYLDVGTGDLPLTWQAFTGLGYHTASIDYSLGYRYLAFEANSDARVKSLDMGGPMVAASFHF